MIQLRYHVIYHPHIKQKLVGLVDFCFGFVTAHVVAYFLISLRVNFTIARLDK